MSHTNLGRMSSILLAFAVAGSMLAAGCTNTATGPVETGGDPYPARTHPDSVLVKLNLAYEAMDLDAYLDCMADSFFFHLRYEDCNDPQNNLPPYWNKSMEAALHEAMFEGDDGADSLDLWMTTLASELDEGVPSDPYDDRWTYVMGVTLRLYVGNWIYLANADQQFVFAVQPVEDGALWYMTEWYELSAESGREEESSWGRVKAMFGIWGPPL